MTTGFFTSDDEPARRPPPRPQPSTGGGSSHRHGLDEELTLPSDLIASLDLPGMTQEEVVLGDGTVRTVQMYAASVVFAGETRRILVGEAPTTPLMGTDLLRGFSLRVEFWEGGQVEIRKRPA